MEKAKLIVNGGSQAVRLPKAFRFEGQEVYVKKMGNGVLLIPLNGAWDMMLEAIDQFEGEIERGEQGKLEEREEL